MNEILFVDDEPDILGGLRNALRRQRSRWNMRFAVGGEAALRDLEARPCDVIVSDMRMPGMDGLTLLGLMRERHPQTARIVLSGHAELDTVVRASSVAHQYLMKPCDADTLCGAVDRALGIQALVTNPELRRVIGGLGTLPSPSATYAALTGALADPNVSIGRLAEIVRQDIGLTARALQLVNSAYCGLAQRVTKVETAIATLGLNMLRHLALTVEVFRGFAHDGSTFDTLERHAFLTARLARRLAANQREADVAFAAGLLHDAGKLVLMSRAPDAYQAAAELSFRSGISLLDAEKDSLGATHAEVGAFLLGLWDLPHAIIEPVAYHHASLDRDGRRDTRSAVTFADALAHDATGGSTAEGIDQVLAEPSAFGDVARWRELARAEARTT